MPAPTDDAVTVSWLDPRALPAGTTGMLDRDERMRVEASTDAGAARRSAAAFVLLRCTVAFLLGREPREVTVQRRCPRCAAPHGRPELPGSPMSVSVSHAGARVAVAVSTRSAVGVDVEAPRGRPLSRALLRRALTAAEQEYLLTVPAERRTSEFLRAWTAKEALLKATGAGLPGGPTRIDLDLSARSVRLRSWAGSRTRADAVRLVEVVPGGGHVATIATIGAGRVSVAHHDGRDLVDRMTR